MALFFVRKKCQQPQGASMRNVVRSNAALTLRMSSVVLFVSLLPRRHDERYILSPRARGERGGMRSQRWWERRGHGTPSD